MRSASPKSTVKTHFAGAFFEKTGTSRQADLTRLAGKTVPTDLASRSARSSAIAPPRGSGTCCADQAQHLRKPARDPRLSHHLVHRRRVAWHRACFTRLQPVFRAGFAREPSWRRSAATLGIVPHMAAAIMGRRRAATHERPSPSRSSNMPASPISSTWRGTRCASTEP